MRVCKKIFLPFSWKIKTKRKSGACQECTWVAAQTVCSRPSCSLMCVVLYLRWWWGCCCLLLLYYYILVSLALALGKVENSNCVVCLSCMISSRTLQCTKFHIEIFYSKKCMWFLCMLCVITVAFGFYQIEKNK